MEKRKTASVSELFAVYAMSIESDAAKSQKGSILLRNHAGKEMKNSRLDYKTRNESKVGCAGERTCVYHANGSVSGAKHDKCSACAAQAKRNRTSVGGRGIFNKE